jgi:N-acetylmuramoyl-L-alanine amidase
VQRFLPFLLTLVVGAYLQGCGTSQWERGSVTDLPAGRAKKAAEPKPESIHQNSVPSDPVDRRAVESMAMRSSLPPQPVTVRVPQPLIPRAGTPGSARTSDWLPLGYWASSQGVGGLKRISTNQYHLVTHWGVFGLAAKARYAVFNGWRVYLGYPLRQTNGVPFIHRLDAENNLRPLVGSYHPLPQRTKTICIDPGHGGTHTGTKSVLGAYYEKSYALDWAKRLRPLLERKGWRVVLTRSDDKTLSIDERVAVADKFNADLFVSLHFNSAGKGAKGLETYCTTPRGMPSTLTRGYSDPMRVLLPNNTHNPINMHLAAKVHNALIRNVRMEDRGIRRARFMSVIAKQNRPAVLIEGGYLSDPVEARLIGSSKYRQQLAEGLAKAF